MHIFMYFIHIYKKEKLSMDKCIEYCLNQSLA